MANGMAAPNVDTVRTWCVDNNKKVPTCIASITQEDANTVFAGKRKDELGRENPVYTTLVRLNSQMGNGVKSNPVARTAQSAVTSLPTIAEIDVQIAKLQTLREALVAMANIALANVEETSVEAVTTEDEQETVAEETSDTEVAE